MILTVLKNHLNLSYDYLKSLLNFERYLVIWISWEKIPTYITAIPRIFVVF